MFEAERREQTLGQRIRVKPEWDNIGLDLLPAGTTPTGFVHVPAGPFLRGRDDAALQPAEGGFVELTFTEPGHYTTVSHVMSDAERGAHGIVNVTE